MKKPLGAHLFHRDSRTAADRIGHDQQTSTSLETSQRAYTIYNGLLHERGELQSPEQIARALAYQSVRSSSSAIHGTLHYNSITEKEWSWDP